MDAGKKYKGIIEHYEACLDKYGDTHKGVDWPKIEDAETRYSVMLDIIYLKKDFSNNKLLDFGCGTAHLLEHMNKSSRYQLLEYSGLDFSQKYIDVCRRKFPEQKFYCGDILDEDFQIPTFDFVIMNGVFTEKRELSFEEMWDYFKQTLTKVYTLTKKGIAFNVMSKLVDWERDDLFHVPIDLMTNFLCNNLSRDFVIRNDYGLYEYTVYLYKKP